ncbi:tetratricopeptide repeat protein [Legionella jamestowniensis]|uniref:Lipoprotein NlpI n=1 Tax=Legionella jamestowniensis TaxID=455 RepID=A0A0W0UN67_9GAMM|nr:tetratricopeptide repeat protein [Legionella jamestowniensis]KTD09314.1 lipoprotein NlpI [Legionella jamestowniensis]SFL87466.1 Flp pilus assembly protein TadD, contains TPR repeats [Legionella jamestowniensis DSM 19215]
MKNTENELKQTEDRTLSSLSSEESLEKSKLHDSTVIGSIAHGISNLNTAVHMTGLHVMPKQLKYVGPVAEVISEIIHNPSEPVVEKIVCGTGVALAKEGINSTVAAVSGVTIGSVASLGTTPIGGAFVGAAVATGAYVMADKITTPMGKVVTDACHQAFEAMSDTSDKQKTSNEWKNIDISLNRLNEIEESIKQRKSELENYDNEDNLEVSIPPESEEDISILIANIAQLSTNDVLDALNELYEQEAYDDAIKLLSAALAQGENNLRFHNELAYCYEAIDEFDKALSHCDKAANLNPMDLSSYYIRTRIYLNKNQSDLALQDIQYLLTFDRSDEEFIAIKRELAEYCYDASINKLAEGMNEVALRFINAALDLYTEDKDLLYLQRSKVYLGMEAYDLAFDECEKILTHNPESQEAKIQNLLILAHMNSKAKEYIQQGQQAFGNDDYQAAKEEAHKALNLVETVDADYLLGMANLYLENIDEAIANFTSAIVLEPDNPDLYLARAYANHFSINRVQLFADYDKALELLEGADNFTEMKQQIANNLHHHATSDFASGDLEGALLVEKQAIQYEPNAPEYQQFKQAVEREINLNEAERLLNESIVAYDENNVQKALTLINQSLQLNPNGAEAFGHRGNCYIKLNQFTNAEQAYMRAIGIDPNCATAYNNLAFVSYQLNKYEQALENSNKFLSFEPNHESGLAIKVAAEEQIRQRVQLAESQKQAQAVEATAPKVAPTQQSVKFFLDKKGQSRREWKKAYYESEEGKAMLAATAKKRAEKAAKREKRAAQYPTSQNHDPFAMSHKVQQNMRAHSHFIASHSIQPTSYTSSISLQNSMARSKESLQKTTIAVQNAATACGQIGHQIQINHLKQQLEAKVSSQGMFSKSASSAPKVATPNPAIVNEIKKEIANEKAQGIVSGKAADGVDITKKWPGCRVRHFLTTENTAGRQVHYYDVNCPTDSGETRVFSGYTISK